MPLFHFCELCCFGNRIIEIPETIDQPVSFCILTGPDVALGDFINLSALDNGLGAFLVSPAAKIVSLIVFGLLMLTMCKFTIWHKENRK